MAKTTGSTPPKQQSKAALLRTLKSSDIDEVALSDCVGLFVEVDRAIARRQDTSSAILERLSHHSDKIVRQAVAGHHNILSEDLMRLGKQFPDAFLSNPALDLILIENPGLLLNINESLLVQIAKRDACPEVFLKWATRQGSEQVLMAIAMNPSTPVELLQQLLVSEFKTVQDAVRFHKKLLAGMEVSDIQAHFKQAVIERLGALTLSEANQMWKRKEISLVHFCYLSVSARLFIASDEDLYSIAINPTTPAWVLADIAKQNDKYVLLDLAEDPNTPSAFLRLLAKDKDYWMRSRVAENSNAPEALLEQLAKDKDRFVRWTVAKNPNASEALLRLLSEDEDSGVRQGIASNSNTPVNLLMLLSEDEDSWVRRYVAGNSNTPEALLTLLSEDEDSGVREGIAGNQNTSIESLMTLAEDYNDTNLNVLWNIFSNPSAPRELVQKLLPVFLADLERNKDRDFLIETPNVPVEFQQQSLPIFAKDKSKKRRLYAAENIKTPSTSLALLAKDKLKLIRNAVAKNPNTPEASLILLSEDNDSEVRCSVAANSNAPENLLILLSKDKNSRVRQSVAANSNAPENLLMLLSEDKVENVRESVANNSNTPEALLEQLAKDKDCFVRWTVAKNPNASEALLTLLSEDEDSFVRRAVADNSNCSLSILQALSIDEDTYVRNNVVSNPKTTKAMLESFVKDKRPTVRSSIAFNPKCSDELLIQLCHDKNLSIDAKVSAIEKLNFPEDILALPHFNSILQTKAMPEKVLIRLGQHEDNEVRSAALSNPLHPSWIKSLIEAPKTNALFIKWANESQQSAQSALESDNVFFFAGKDANKAAGSKSELVRILAMSYGASVEPTRLAKSQKHNDWLVRMSIASNIGTPINALNKLTQDSHALVAKQAEMTIAKLSGKSDIELLVDEEVRHSSFYELSQDIAVALKSKHHQTVAIDDPVWGRCINPAVLWEPSRINEVTDVWADGEWKLFGEWILPLAPEALAPYLTSEATETFMLNHLKRKKKSIEYLASHIHYSEAAFKFLSKDKNVDVRERIASNLNTPEALLMRFSEDKDSGVRSGVAGNQNTPEALLRLLSEDEDWLVRCGVARNSNTPEALLTLLSEDKDSWVRRNVAGNQNTSIESLMTLAEDNNKSVRYNAVKNLDASKVTDEISSTNKYACLQSLSLSEYKEHIRIALSPKITLPTDITTLDIRRGIESLGLLREEISRKELTQMRISKDRLQRVAVCFHHQVTENLLAILSEDKDLAVAEIAKEMLATFDVNATYAL